METTQEVNHLEQGIALLLHGFEHGDFYPGLFSSNITSASGLATSSVVSVGE